MTVFKNRHFRRILILGVLCFVCFFFVSSTFASEDVCKKALTRCTADAVLTGIISGPQSFFLYYSACFMGYTWCLKYYNPQN